MYIFTYFVEPIRGTESAWFIGDGFASNSFEQYFSERSLRSYNAGYVRLNYNVLGKVTNQYISNSKNILIRIRAMLYSAIKDEVKLPKYIVNVFDDDIMKNLKPEITESDDLLNKVIGYIMKEQSKLIEIQREYLPEKAKRSGFPQIIWIEAPVHDCFNNNETRHIYNKSLAKAAQHQENVTILKLKKIWDPTDINLFVEDSDRYTSDGYSNYWAAVDYTMKFMDTILIKKLRNRNSKKGKKQVKIPGKRSKSFNKYHWQSKNYEGNHTQSHQYGNDDSSCSYEYGEDESYDRRPLPKPREYYDY